MSNADRSSISEKERGNMLRHHDHLLVVAHGTPAERRYVLDHADTNLVRAMAASARVAHGDGLLPEAVYSKHSRKLNIAISKNNAIRTKEKLVKSQRGGSFWSAIAKVVLPILGGIGGAYVGGPLGGTAGSATGELLASQIGTGKRKRR